MSLDEDKIIEILDGLKKGDDRMEKLGVDYIREASEARGLEKGVEIGLELSMKIIRAIKENLPMQQIASQLGVTNDQIEELKKELTTIG